MHQNEELTGRLIGVTAERRTNVQERFLHSRGASTLLAPVLHTVDSSDRPELLEVAQGILNNPPDVLVVQTGQGLKWWLESLPDELRNQVIASLSTCDIWCRGPKAASATKNLGLAVGWQSPRELAVEIAERMAETGLTDKQVIVQLDGTSGQNLVQVATDNGAKAIGLDVYRYQLPEDREPVAQLINGVIDGSIDAVTFTASPQIRHLREMAGDVDQLGLLDEAFRNRCLAVVVGPVCAQTARTAGWTNIAEPETARLLPMLETLRVALIRD